MYLMPPYRICSACGAIHTATLDTEDLGFTCEVCGDKHDPWIRETITHAESASCAIMKANNRAQHEPYIVGERDWSCRVR